MSNPANIGPVPMSFTPDQQDFLQRIVSVTKDIQKSIAPPNAPTNLKVTPKAGGNIVRFTRSNGTDYTIYRNTSPTLNGAIRFDLGLGNEFVDDIGKGSETLYYWAIAKIGQLASVVCGPISGTTLALGVAITPPAPPPASQTPTTSNIDNQTIPGTPTSGGYSEDL